MKKRHSSASLVSSSVGSLMVRLRRRACEKGMARFVGWKDLSVGLFVENRSLDVVVGVDVECAVQEVELPTSVFHCEPEAGM